MQRRFWAGAVRPFGFPSLNVLRLPSKRLRNGHLAWGDFASKLSFERTGFVFDFMTVPVCLTLLEDARLWLRSAPCSVS